MRRWIVFLALPRVPDDIAGVHLRCRLSAVERTSFIERQVSLKEELNRLSRQRTREMSAKCQKRTLLNCSVASAGLMAKLEAAQRERDEALEQLARGEYGPGVSLERMTSEKRLNNTRSFGSI